MSKVSQNINIQIGFHVWRNIFLSNARFAQLLQTRRSRNVTELIETAIKVGGTTYALQINDGRLAVIFVNSSTLAIFVGVECLLDRYGGLL